MRFDSVGRGDVLWSYEDVVHLFVCPLVLLPLVLAEHLNLGLGGGRRVRKKMKKKRVKRRKRVKKKRVKK